jgi:hypothetical protein
MAATHRSRREQHPRSPTLRPARDRTRPTGRRLRTRSLSGRGDGTPDRPGRFRSAWQARAGAQSSRHAACHLVATDGSAPAQPGRAHDLPGRRPLHERQSLPGGDPEGHCRADAECQDRGAPEARRLHGRRSGALAGDPGQCGAGGDGHRPLQYLCARGGGALHAPGGARHSHGAAGERSLHRPRARRQLQGRHASAAIHLRAASGQRQDSSPVARIRRRPGPRFRRCGHGRHRAGADFSSHTRGV